MWIVTRITGLVAAVTDIGNRSGGSAGLDI
jgi:hypothetical protein